VCAHLISKVHTTVWAISNRHDLNSRVQSLQPSSQKAEHLLHNWQRSLPIRNSKFVSRSTLDFETV